MKRYLLTPLVLQAGIVFAAECDCQILKGSCQGSIELVKTYGSKPSYGADLIVHSSERRCSKVEYSVGGTPYQTLIVNKMSETDSVFGTSPITPNSVKFESCKVCAVVSNSQILPAPKSPDDANKPDDYDLSGIWESIQTCSWGSGSSQMRIDYNKATGNISGKLANATIDSGTIKNGDIVISASNWLGNRINMVGRVQDASHMSGTYTQGTTSEKCQWVSTKSK